MSLTRSLQLICCFCLLLILVELPLSSHCSQSFDGKFENSFSATFKLSYKRGKKVHSHEREKERMEKNRLNIRGSMANCIFATKKAILIEAWTNIIYTSHMLTHTASEKKGLARAGKQRQLADLCASRRERNVIKNLRPYSAKKSEHKLQTDESVRNIEGMGRMRVFTSSR